MLLFSLLISRFLTEEEIDNMKSELEKYGIQMPAFSKIGGILANELSVDEAACECCSVEGSHWLSSNVWFSGESTLYCGEVF